MQKQPSRGALMKKRPPPSPTHNLGPLKEIECLVLFKEHFFKPKLLCEKFVGYLCEGFLNISLNINGATFLLTLFIKSRCWYKLI